MGPSWWERLPVAQEEEQDGAIAASSLAIQHGLNWTNLTIDVPLPPVQAIKSLSVLFSGLIIGLLLYSSCSPSVSSQYSTRVCLLKLSLLDYQCQEAGFFGLYCTVLDSGCQKQCLAHFTWYFNNCSMNGYIITSFLKQSMRRLTCYLLVISRLLPPQHSKALPLSNP